MKKMLSIGRRKVRRGPARLFVVGATVAATAAVSARPAEAQGPATEGRAQTAPAPTFRFDLPAGMLEDVAAMFTRVTGIAITFANPDIAIIQSPGASGTMTAEAAMTALLMGTSVRATFTVQGATLDLGGVSEFVQVSASTASVSSPKYPVRLRDVAQSIAIIPRKVMDQQGATTLGEALRNVPGITLQAGEGGGASNTAGDMFNLRGFNASNSLFSDGVRDDGLIARDVFNLEQVEVFMGPTGSDVGRGTAAGYVNMQTKAPHLGSSTNVAYSQGTAAQQRLSADFNWAVPQSQNGGWLSKSAFRLNALWQDAGQPGRDLVTRNSTALAPSFSLGLGTPTRVIVSGQVMRQDNLPDYGIPGAAFQDYPLAPTTVIADKPVDQSNFFGSVGYDYDKASQGTVLARVEHDLSRNRTLRNQLRYNRTHREAVVSAIQNVAAFNPETEMVTIARQGNDRENTILSNQTSIADRFSALGLRHAATAGLEMTRETQFSPTLTGLGTRAATSIYSPSAHEAVIGYAPSRTLAATTGDTNTVGAYLFDTVEVNSRLQVSGGIRWDRYDTNFLQTDVAGAATTTLADSDNFVTGKASVLFRVNAQGNVYLAYGTSVTPPGAANFALSGQVNNQNNPSLKPQESTNLELGSKWDVAGGRLSLNGAVFHTENKNVIYTIDATAIPPLYNQDDGQLVNGVTLGALGRITDRWEILANIGYLDTEQQSQNPANDGRQLTLTPELSSSIWSTYRVSNQLMFGGGIRHTDAVFVNTANTIRVPSYQIVDALAQYAINSHFTLRLNVNNLTDATYIRNVNNNGGRYNPGFARSVMLTTDVGF